MDDGVTVAVVGLGYVGLPLAVAFGSRLQTVGFDLNEKKIAAYKQGLDPSGEVSAEKLALATRLTLTSDPAQLRHADIVIIVVPTPIDKARRPDLAPLTSATGTVGRNLKDGATVIFESTVYPGCTEEVCVPILERESGFVWGATTSSSEKQHRFYVGYSPERINPGDDTHKLEKITKVVSGDTQETLERAAALYGQIVDAGIHRAVSIKVAEAAKVIENTQRDLNIALMNELAMIFDRLEIDTLDVLEAAGTKWNFLPFRPGLVGGHCIGVDPYYLTYKAESVGYHPQVVLGGRRVNDGMARYIAEQTVKRLSRHERKSSKPRIAMLGVTFKENCADLRNSKVIDLVRELQEYGCEVSLHDPIANPIEVEQEFELEISSIESTDLVDAVVLAVPHAEYRENSVALLKRLLGPTGLAIDVKSVLDRSSPAVAGYDIWRL